MFRFFRGLKLYFTDRPYYKQWKRYMKRQDTVRKKLKKQTAEFCPWSGYYMHRMVQTMLEFYHATYEAKDCCWSESARVGRVESSLSKALEQAKALDRIDDLESEELLRLAQEDSDFAQYVTDWEKKSDYCLETASHKETLLASVAEEFLIEKYTKAMYNIIGKHIWEWCD